MPKINVARKSTSVDMTAMCDVSFLLLTFFILTSKFKPADPVMIDIPSARSMTKIEKAIVISLSKDGKAYLAFADQEMRRETLQKMVERVGERFPDLKTITPEQTKQFGFIEVFGTPLEDLPRVLKLNGGDYKTYQDKLPGIPTDSVHNQLADWIWAARYANPQMKIAIKGDKSTNIKDVQRVIEILTKDADVHRFNLITTLGGATTTEEKKEE